MMKQYSGMDKPVAKNAFSIKKLLSVLLLSILTGLLIYGLFLHDPVQSTTIEEERVTISEVKEDSFREYISVNGSVIPDRTVYLDAVESGRVGNILVDDGEVIEHGDTILIMENNQLQLDVLNREAQILEQINNLQNTRLVLQQERLRVRDELISRKYDLQRIEEEYDRSRILSEKDMIAHSEYSRLRQQYHRAKEQLDLMIESSHVDSISTVHQLQHIESSLERMMMNLNMVTQSLDYLVLTAPVSGQLSSFSAEIGESKNQGERLGQIDVLDGYRIRAGIDEHYLSRVTIGLPGSFTFAGQTHELEVTRIFPEVTAGRFDVELTFPGEAPEGIRRGQTVRLRLELGETTESIVLPRGGFTQSTGGNWVFVLNEERTQAFRRSVQFGRQNPEYFEVLDGLETGEYVITSNYENFQEFDQLLIQSSPETSDRGVHRFSP